MISGKTWSLYLFGKPRVVGQDAVLDQFGTKRSAFLLARLAIAQRHAMTRNHAADTLWPEDYFDATRLRLRQELTRLRRALGPARGIIDADEDWIRLNTSDMSIDLEAFEDIYRRTRHENAHLDKEALFHEALAISEEEFVAGASEMWIEAERQRLLDIRCTLMLELAEIHSQKGKHEESLALAREVIAVAPLRESGHVLAMQELGHLGFLADALNQYQQLKRLLKDEGQKTPSRAAEQVAESLISQSGSRIRQPIPHGLRFSAPYSTERIFGRETEISQLSLLFSKESRVRLVTLLGPGGIGKTRLAMELADRLQAQFEGRVGFVGLADLNDPAFISLSIVQALQLAASGSNDPLDQLRSALPSEPTLLILDNLEHLVPEACKTVAALLEANPLLKLLTTSRNALNISGECVLPVLPLALPTSLPLEDALESPAIQLLLDAYKGEPENSVYDESDARALLEIAERLEGIPLALQLAASRLRTLMPNQLLAQIGRGLDLTNRRLDAPERHKSLRNAIEGSYEALSDDLRRAAGRLAYFRGGWTLEAAARVCELEDSVVVLEELLDSSLVRVDKEGRHLRFRMLETIRDYFLERLTDDERLAAGFAHTRWLLDLIAPASGRHTNSAAIKRFRDLDQELDNIREACRFTLAHDLESACKLGASLGPYWFNRGMSTDATRFYEELIRRSNGLPANQDFASAMFSYMRVCHAAHLYSEDTIGVGIFDFARGVCRDAGLRAEEALVLAHHSAIPLSKSNKEENHRMLAEAEAIVAQFGNEADIAAVKRLRGNALYYQGELDRSIALLREALKTFEAQDVPFSRVWTQQTLAYATFETQDLDACEALLDGLLEDTERIGGTVMVPGIYEINGRVVLERGDALQAISFFEASLQGWREIGEQFQIADQMNSLGRAHARNGEARKAISSLREAVERWAKTDSPIAVCVALHSAAEAWLVAGEPERAARILGGALREGKRLGASYIKTELAYIARLDNALETALGAEKKAELMAEVDDYPKVEELALSELPA